MNEDRPNENDAPEDDVPRREVAPPEQSEAPQMVTGVDRSKRLLRAGMFAAVGAALLIVGVFVIGNKQNLFNKTIDVYTVFRSVEGLKAGAPVMVSGIKIGTVSAVTLRMDTSTNVRVDMQLEGDYWPFLRTSTVATISQSGLIGDKLIQLQVTDASADLIRPGDSIPSIAPIDYTVIFEDARAAVKNTENITASLDTLFSRTTRGEGTLGKLVTDEAAYNSLVNMSKSADRLFVNADQQVAMMSGSMNRAATHVENLTFETSKMIQSVSQGAGTLGALITNRSLYDSLEALSGTLNEAAHSAGFAAREFGLDMRGLRNNWLVGGLFGGGKDEDNVELKQRELQIREEELRRQRQLLDQREQQILKMQREGNIQTLNPR